MVRQRVGYAHLGNIVHAQQLHLRRHVTTVPHIRFPPSSAARTLLIVVATLVSPTWAGGNVRLVLRERTRMSLDHYHALHVLKIRTQRPMLAPVCRARSIRSQKKGATTGRIACVGLDTAARRPETSARRARQTPSKVSTVQAHVSRAIRANFLLRLQSHVQALRWHRLARRGIQEEAV